MNPTGEGRHAAARGVDDAHDTGRQQESDDQDRVDGGPSRSPPGLGPAAARPALGTSRHEDETSCSGDLQGRLLPHRTGGPRARTPTRLQRATGEVPDAGAAGAGPTMATAAVMLTRAIRTSRSQDATMRRTLRAGCVRSRPRERTRPRKLGRRALRSRPRSPGTAGRRPRAPPRGWGRRSSSEVDPAPRRVGSGAMPDSSLQTHNRLLQALDQLLEEVQRVADRGINEWASLAMLDAIDCGRQVEFTPAVPFPRSVRPPSSNPTTRSSG